MKNLCFFNSCTAWGGGEKWHYLAARWCCRRGYNVLVISNTHSELARRLLAEGLTVQQIRISNLSFLNPFKIWRVFRLFKDFQIDTLFLNLPADVKVAAPAAKIADISQVFYRRGMALPVRNNWLNRIIFRRFLTGIIANSQEVRRTILQKNAVLVPQEKIQVLYNGLDLDAYDRQDVTPLYSRQDDEIILGSAGRFVEQKGQHYLVELAKALKNRGLRFKLLLAGKGKLEEQLRRQVEDYGLERELLFVGFVENIKAFLESIDLFISTSLHEGSSNVILETMASAKALVAFNVSSIPEMVTHEQSGLLVPLGDVEALTNAVANLMENAALRGEFGRNGRRRIEEHFSLRTTFAKLEQIIEHG